MAATARATTAAARRQAGTRRRSASTTATTANPGASSGSCLGGGSRRWFQSPPAPGRRRCLGRARGRRRGRVWWLGAVTSVRRVRDCRRRFAGRPSGSVCGAVVQRASDCLLDDWASSASTGGGPADRFGRHRASDVGLACRRGRRGGRSGLATVVPLGGRRTSGGSAPVGSACGPAAFPRSDRSRGRQTPARHPAPPTSSPEATRQAAAAMRTREATWPHLSRRRMVPAAPTVGLADRHDSRTNAAHCLLAARTSAIAGPERDRGAAGDSVGGTSAATIARSRRDDREAAGMGLFTTAEEPGDSACRGPAIKAKAKLEARLAAKNEARRIKADGQTPGQGDQGGPQGAAGQRPGRPEGCRDAAQGRPRGQAALAVAHSPRADHLADAGARRRADRLPRRHRRARLRRRASRRPAGRPAEPDRPVLRRRRRAVGPHRRRRADAAPRSRRRSRRTPRPSSSSRP